jgi:phosphoribosylformimino-5-aminoimidazole carboxamide ribotide isomerase
MLSLAMFDVIPAVDIQRGRAVRLYEGDPARETVYYPSPVAAAQHWVGLGASWLHVVDLDAALGRGTNRALVLELAAAVDAGVEIGGGVRSVDAAQAWLERLDRVILGTVAIREPEVLDSLIADFGPERVAVSIDARGGRVAVHGWSEVTDIDAVELARRVAEQGVRHLIYTDIDRDGTLRGVDAEPVRRMRAAFPHRLVAGGGVGDDADLELYERLGLDGAIVGRALYEGTITYPRTA